LCLYKVHPYIIVTQFRLYQHQDKNGILQKTLNVNNETHFDDFYKLIPHLKLTKKSEYLVIDDLIEA